VRVEYFPYRPFAGRVWQMRENVTAYDAWYVAVAETIEADLATLDAKLATAPGPRCRFVTPG
jgi:predicted nucleic acid-binding protein